MQDICCCEDSKGKAKQRTCYLCLVCYVDAVVGMLQALGKLRVFSQHNCICLELSFPYWIHGSPKTPQKQRWEKHSDLLLRCTNFRTVKYSIACNQKRTYKVLIFLLRLPLHLYFWKTLNI